MNTIDVYLNKAKSQKGVSEFPKGSNRGPIVDKYIEYTGLDPAGKYPWCACFVSWVLGTSLEQKLFNTADCDVVLSFAKNKGILYSTPKVGDLFLVIKSESNAIHIGFVTSVTNSSFQTIEGNTNDEGSREGYEVAARTRYLNGTIKYRFVRIIDLLPEKIEDWNAEFPNGNKIPLVNLADTNYSHIREFFLALFPEKEVTKNIFYDSKTKFVSYKGVSIGKCTIINNKAYLPIRELVKFVGLQIESIENKTVYIK